MLSEPFAVQDLYVDEIEIEAMRNGLYRVSLIRETDHGKEALPYALVGALPNIMEAMCKTADAIGLRFSGSFYWDKPH